VYKHCCQLLAQHGKGQCGEGTLNCGPPMSREEITSMASVFFLTKLKAGASPTEYEKWVRDYDYPTAKQLGSIKSYRVHRIEGALLSDKQYDYIEQLEVTDIDSYKRDIDSPVAKELLAQWQRYIGEFVALYGEPF
jgi:hypothetical protein